MKQFSLFLTVVGIAIFSHEGAQAIGRNLTTDTKLCFEKVIHFLSDVTKDEFSGRTPSGQTCLTQIRQQITPNSNVVSFGATIYESKDLTTAPFSDLIPTTSARIHYQVEVPSANNPLHGMIDELTVFRCEVRENYLNLIFDRDQRSAWRKKYSYNFQLIKEDRTITFAKLRETQKSQELFVGDESITKECTTQDF